MHDRYSYPSIAPKYALHAHSQNSLFHTKFVKQTMLPSATTSNSDSTPAKRSMIAELFPI